LPRRKPGASAPKASAWRIIVSVSKKDRSVPRNVSARTAATSSEHPHDLCVSLLRSTRILYPLPSDSRHPIDSIPFITLFLPSKTPHQSLFSLFRTHRSNAHGVRFGSLGGNVGWLLNILERWGHGGLLWCTSVHRPASYPCSNRSRHLWASVS
jgi:hypothetical protein